MLIDGATPLFYSSSTNNTMENVFIRGRINLNSSSINISHTSVQVPSMPSISATNSTIFLNNVNITGSANLHLTSNSYLFGTSVSSSFCLSPLLVNHSQLILENSDFSWNIGSQKGAGIFASDSQLNLTRVKFFMNQLNGADASGSAIYSQLSSVFLDSCLFLNNSAEAGGGATYSNNDIIFQCINCTYTSNSSPAGSGGGAFVSGSNALFQNSIFSLNKAHTGGAMRCSNNSLTLNNCNITNNKAFGTGGGLSTGDGINTTIIDSLFAFNNASAGGGIHHSSFTSTNSPIFINSSVIENNRAEATSGGGMLIFGQNINIQATILYSRISNNRAISNGAGAYVESTEIILKNITCTSNIATTGGGGFYFGQLCSVDMESSIISNNSALIRGGGVQIFQSIKSNFISSKFLYNYASVGGGLDCMSIPDASLRVEDCEFILNTAITTGGGIAIWQLGGI